MAKKKEIIKGWTPHWRACVREIKKDIREQKFCSHSFVLVENRDAWIDFMDATETRKGCNLRITVEEI